MKFKKKIICFDIDGVICTNTYGDYKNAKPFNKSINKINQLYDSGFKIILFTSRYMTICKGDISLIYKKYYNTTVEQLENWNIKYHELIFGKPEYDMIIDDKSYNYDEDWGSIV